MSDLIHPIPAFNDNYIWLFRRPGSREAAVVDPGDAEPVRAYLQEHDLQLRCILVTHHHADHTGGVNALASEHQATVYGPRSSPFEGIHKLLQEGEHLTVLDFTFQVLEVPGHTLDHIAFYCEQAPDTGSPLVFCGDTLFAAGCGRIFEGDPPMMYRSLQKLAALPGATRVYCAHEYTLANLKFALAAEPENRQLQRRLADASQCRAEDRPTLPSSLAEEMTTNPFLRCTEQDLTRSAAGKAGENLSDPIEVFTTLRRWKDNF